MAGPHHLRHFCAPWSQSFGVVMDIGNVSFHFAFVAEDIFHLNDIYKEVYNYYN